MVAVTLSEEFRSAVKDLISRGQYPDNASLRRALGKPAPTRSGLGSAQSRYRQAEVEKAGYDWEASKRTRQLVKAQTKR